MDIVINYSSAQPIYRQLYEQLRSQIMSGELKSHAVLPPIRTVAVELGISVITVKKAWEELERDGLIVTVAGKGCFVAGLREGELSSKRFDMLRRRIAEDLEYYRSFGIDDVGLLELIQNEMSTQD